MNSNLTPIYSPFKPPFKYDDMGSCLLDSNDNKILDVRGWGFLTGRGALALDDETAISIQNGIGQNVTNLMNDYAKLNGYEF